MVLFDDAPLLVDEIVGVFWLEELVRLRDAVFGQRGLLHSLRQGARVLLLVLHERARNAHLLHLLRAGQPAELLLDL